MEKSTKYLDGRGWTTEQSNELKEKYPNTFNKDLIKIFNKSNSSILEKAKRLGVKKDRELLASRRRTLRIGSTSHRKGISMNDEYGIDEAMEDFDSMSEREAERRAEIGMFEGGFSGRRGF